MSPLYRRYWMRGSVSTPRAMIMKSPLYRYGYCIYSCEHGNVPTVQAILDEGVSVDSTGDDYEITPLQVRLLYL